MKINKSASRSIDILVLLSKSEKSLTQLEVSNALGIPKSSTFDLMYTLLEKGVIEFDNEELRTFRLGMKMFELGSSVLGKIDLYTVAKPYLTQLSDTVQETIFLGNECDGEVVYLDRIDKNISAITTVAGIGMRRPAYCTGLGKAIMATYANDKIVEVWKRYSKVHSIEKYTKHTITDCNEFLHDVRKIRRRGYAIDNRERENEIFCLAAPIFNTSDVAIAAISISTLYLKMNKERIRMYSKLLVNTALDLSRNLGYQKNYLYHKE